VRSVVGDVRNARQLRFLVLLLACSYKLRLSVISDCLRSLWPAQVCKVKICSKGQGQGLWWFVVCLVVSLGLGGRHWVGAVWNVQPCSITLSVMLRLESFKSIGCSPSRWTSHAQKSGTCACLVKGLAPWQLLVFSWQLPWLCKCCSSAKLPSNT
jgi:hypothetical protein